MAVTACRRERIEDSRQSLIENRVVIPIGLVASRARNPTLADAGRADDEQVLVPFDPFASDELLNSALGPRGDLMSVSSTTAFCLRLANRKRLISRVLSRSVASRSTRRASRSSKANVAMSGCCCCSSSAFGMPVSPSVTRRPWVGMCQHRLSLPQW